MNQIIKRETVEEICNKRNLIIDMYNDAYEKLTIASDALLKADSLRLSFSTKVTSYNQNLDRYILDCIKLPTKDNFDIEVRKNTDRNIWNYLIKFINIENLMNKNLKDDFRNQLYNNPPEISVDTVYATIENLILDSSNIFKKGIAESFSKLDRRFRSHDAFKIGSRIILTNAFDQYGSWNYHRNHQDTIIDIERVFTILDGKQNSDFSSIITAINNSRKSFGKHQSVLETDYFKIRIFENGNCHIWFTRNDLLQKVNRLLGEYYGEVIPEETKHDNYSDETILKDTKTNLARNFGFFPTPPELAYKIIRDEIHLRADINYDILEPSAGTGRLAQLCVGKNTLVDCIEYQKQLADGLKESGLYNNVICGDFLKITPTKLYDFIIMNPPFDKGLDIAHVNHAFSFLKNGGKLISIMSASTEFREDKISVAFRNKIAKNRGRFYDLPRNSFTSVGTNVNVCLLTVTKQDGN